MEIAAELEERLKQTRTVQKFVLGQEKLVLSQTEMLPDHPGWLSGITRGCSRIQDRSTSSGQ